MRIQGGAIVLWATLAAAACDDARRGEGPMRSPLLHTPEPLERPIDLARAARDPGELVRAATAPHELSAARLGAHRFTGTAKLRVSEQANEVEALDETTRIDYARGGDFHAVYENSRDYGRDVFHQAGRLWIRPRWGKFHRRAATSAAEPARIAGEIYGTLGAHLELCAPGLAIAGQAPAEVAGRKAVRVTLAAGPRRGVRAGADRPEKAWRAETTVESLSGEIVLDGETGAVLEGRLAARVVFVREGRSYTLALEATHEIRDIGQPAPLVVPGDAESVDTPPRSTELDERERLLEGIAPPLRRAATGGAPGGSP